MSEDVRHDLRATAAAFLMPGEALAGLNCGERPSVFTSHN
ncbi:hypothetical protein AGRO_1370 [Agrobacterium sp. ATCC 31749]|nr:hypothetical protein AGRO_1370 [Agrobacterium sp. ATCC 31749]